MSGSNKLWLLALLFFHVSPSFAYDQLEDSAGAPSISPTQAKNDKEEVDRTLAPILKLLGLKTGGIERVHQAGIFLTELIDIHQKYAISSTEKYQRLQYIAEQAEVQAGQYAKIKKKDKLKKDLPALKKQINDLKLCRKVTDFLIDYFILDLKRFKRTQLHASAACYSGVGAGMGFGVVTKLSGKRSLIFCPSVGLTLGLGGDATIGRSESIDSCYVQQRELLHQAMIVSLVQEQDPRNLFLSQGPVVSRGVGLGLVNILELNADVPFWRLSKKYGFARKRLGIVY